MPNQTRRPFLVSQCTLLFFFLYISSHLLILCLSDVTNLNFWISVNIVSVFSGGSGDETTLWWPAVMQWPVVSAASNWNIVPSARGKLGQVQLSLLLTCNLINERNNTRRSCVAISFFPLTQSTNQDKLNITTRQSHSSPLNPRATWESHHLENLDINPKLLENNTFPHHTRCYPLK